MSIKKINDLKRIQRLAEQGGGKERVEKQHEAGKLTARERVEKLLDHESFVEIDKFVTHKNTNFGLAEQKFLGDGVVCGYGKIDGRKVFIFSQDFTVIGGSLSESNAKKIVKVMDLALQNGCPIIGLNDSGGARIQEGVASLAGYAEIFYRNVRCSGVIPQISAVLGPCAGGAVYSPALTDFILMTDKTSHMFITGPDVIRAVTKEEIDKESLGGAETHSKKSGVAHLMASDEEDCFAKVRKLLSFLPQNNNQKPEIIHSEEHSSKISKELNKIVPEDQSKPYDIKEVITRVIDSGDFFEIQGAFARNIVIGFARLGGRSVGIVANQPKYLAGCLDIDASVKAGRFVRFCDAFNIPLVTFVDVPGFLPGTNQEFGGIIRHGAKLLYAYAEATVPKITLITRKAYGGAYDVMSSKHIRGDVNLAYPTAEIAVMGPEGAVNIIFRKELSEAENPIEKHAKLVEEYRAQFANPWDAASLGYIDAVIEPADTRLHLISALEMLETKQVAKPKRKHGNIPL